MKNRKELPLIIAIIVASFIYLLGYYFHSEHFVEVILFFILTHVLYLYYKS